MRRKIERISLPQSIDFSIHALSNYHFGNLTCAGVPSAK